MLRDGYYTRIKHDFLKKKKCFWHQLQTRVPISRKYLCVFLASEKTRGVLPAGIRRERGSRDRDGKGTKWNGEDALGFEGGGSRLGRWWERETSNRSAISFDIIRAPRFGKALGADGGTRRRERETTGRGL